MERRKQAQDRLGLGQTVFGPPQLTSFGEAFPQIQTIQVVATESGQDVNWDRNTHTYSGTLDEYIRCSNTLCNGGFRIADLIRDMVTKHDTHRDDTLLCGGNETSPGGRRIYKPCSNSLQIAVDITYKEQMPEQ